MERKTAEGETAEKTPLGTLESLRQAIEKFELKIANSEDEIKIADYVRLLQLRKELEEDGPKEITVYWIDPWEKP